MDEKKSSNFFHFLFLLSLSIFITSCKPGEVEEEAPIEPNSPTAEETEESDDPINELEFRETAVAQEVNEDEQIKLDSYQFLTLNQEELEVTVNDPNNGIVSEVDGEYYYDGYLNFHGTDEFTIEYKHEEKVILIETYTMTVSPINDAPLADDDSYSLQSGSTLEMDVLANDLDVDGDSLSIQNLTHDSQIGSLEVVNNKVKITSDVGFYGQTSFTYEAKDPSGLTSTATVSLNISQYIEPPSTEGKVPVRLVFINQDNGNTHISDKPAYADRIIEHLNIRFNDNGNKVAEFYLDSIDNINNSYWYDVPASDVAAQLGVMRNNHAIDKKMNIFINYRIQSGIAGIAFLDARYKTTALFENMSTIALERNVVAHEIGHNFGLAHVAQSRPAPVLIGYNGCGMSRTYYQHNIVQYPPPYTLVDGWRVDQNLLYPIAIDDDSYNPFTEGYREVFTDIIECWQEQVLGYPMS